MTGWWVVLVVSGVAVGAVVGFLLPSEFFKVGFYISQSLDNGLKNYTENEGRTVVFEPFGEHKKYINQYIISHRKGKKIVVCKTNGNFSYVNFDIAVFNKYHKVIAVLNVCEQISQNGFTSAVELPSQASYLCIWVNRADEVCLAAPFEPKIPVARLVAFALLTLAFVVAEFLLARVCLANILGEVMTEAFLNSAASLWFTVLAGVVVCAICVVVAVVYLFAQKKSFQKQLADAQAVKNADIRGENEQRI